MDNRYTYLARVSRPLLLLLLTIQFCTISSAQVWISYPQTSKSLSVCSSGDSLFIRLDLTKTTEIEEIELHFPPGVTYIPGSLQRLDGSPDFVIAEKNTSDVSNPTFSTGNTPYRIGQYISFVILRRATCLAYREFLEKGVFKDNVRVKTSAGLVEDFNPEQNGYRISAPSIILSPPPPQGNTIPNATYNRSIFVANTGNACIDRVYFYAVYPVSGLDLLSLSIGNLVLKPFYATGDTLWYELSSNLLGKDSTFCPGERIAIQERLKVLSCAPANAYGVTWGCGSDVSQWCERVDEKGIFILSNGTAIPQATAKTIQQVSFCRDGIVDMTYRNAGTGTATGTMYSLSIKLGHNAGNTYANLPRRDPAITIVEARINDQKVNLTQMGVEPWVLDLSQFNKDPDGTGGISDLDGDGQFDDLAPGAGFVLQFVEKMTCYAQCPMPNYAFAIRTKVDYATLCSGAISSLNLITAQPYYIYHTPTNELSITAPAQVHSGEVINIQACYSTQYNPPTFRPTDSVYLEVTLPAGVRLNGTRGRFQIGGVDVAAADITILGQLVRIRSKGFIQPLCYSFEAIYDCGPNAPSADLNFSFSMYYVGDNACSCVQQWACRNQVVKVACLECKDQPGLLNAAPRVERTSYGFTDNSLRIRVNPATLPALSRQTAAARDEFTLSMGARQVGAPGQTFNSLYFNYQIDKVANQEVLQFIGGTLFWRRGTQQSSCTIGLPEMNASATQQIMNWNFTQLLGTCLPRSLAPGDSLYLELRFVVTTANNGLLYGPNRRIAPGQSAYFYNLASNNQRLYCQDWSPPLYTIGQQRFATAYGSFNLAGCTSITTQNDYGAFYNDPFDVFPNEYRPFAYLDSIVYTLPPGFSMDPNGIAQLLTSNWSTPTRISANTAIKLVPILRGNKLVFINPGNWPTSDLTYNLNFTRNRLHMPIISSCSTPTGALTGEVRYFAKEYFYAGTNAQAGIGTTSAGVINVTPAERPSINLLNLRGTVEGDSPGQWEVEIRNPSSQNAPYLWVAFEDGPDQLGIDIQSLSYGTIQLKPIAYGNGKWYKVDASGVSPGEVIKLAIQFVFQGCAPDSVRMLAGWNCAAYPSSPITSTCAENGLSLKVAPRNAALKLALLSAPTAPLPLLCSPFNVELEYTSIQLGNVFSPKVLVDLPKGMLLNRLRLEYPNGSGNWETITPQRTGNRLSIDLSVHDKLKAKNIPGVLFNDEPNNRAMRISLDLSTDCDFSPGTSLRFIAEGQMDCTVPAQGSGLTIFSEPITIVGVSPPYTPVISATQSIALDGCNNTGELKLSVALLRGKTTTTQADRTLVYLPAGVEYLSYSCTSPNRNNCPTSNPLLSSDAVTGETLLTFNLPVGIPQTSGDSVNLTLKIRPKADAQCSNALPYRIEQRYHARGLFCGRLRCPEMDFVAGTYAQGVISIAKPRVQIASLKAAYAPRTDRGIPVFYEGIIRVLDRKSGQGFLDVDIFCADANRQPLGNRVATQRINLNEDQVFIPIKGQFVACGPDNGIVIQTQIGQCVCAQAGLVLKPIAPCAQVTAQANKAAFCPGEKAVLTATLSNGATLGAWRTLGTGTLSAPSSLSTVYTPSAADLANGKVSVIYGGITGFCGLVEDTVTITLLPTPSLLVTRDLELCNGIKSDSIVLRGNPDGVVFRWINSNPTIGIPTTGVGTIPPFQVINLGTNTTQARLSVTPEITLAGTTCRSNPVNFTITVLPDVLTRDSQEVCIGKSFQLNAPAEGANYQWTPTFGLNNASIANPTNFRGIGVSTEYVANFRTTNNCRAKHTLNVKAIDCRRVAQLGNRVWNDLNNNGLQDVNEPGLANVEVLLYKENTSNPIDSRRSDNAGYFLFGEVNPGTYQLGLTLPLRAYPTLRTSDSPSSNNDLDPLSLRTLPIVLEAGKIDTTYDLGLVFPVQLSGRAWLDADGNGLRDSNEKPLPGIRVNVYSATEGTLLNRNLFDQPLLPKLTDAEGRYVLDSFPPGQYVLEFVAATVPAYQEYTPTILNANANTLDSLDSDVQGTASSARTSPTAVLTGGASIQRLDAGYLSAPCPSEACTARLGQWTLKDLRWSNPSRTPGLDAAVFYQRCSADQTEFPLSDVWPYLPDPQKPGQNIYLNDPLFRCVLNYEVLEQRQAYCNGKGAIITRFIVLRDACDNRVLDTLKVGIQLGDALAPKVLEKPKQGLQLSAVADSCTAWFPVDTAGLAKLGIRFVDNCDAPTFNFRFYSPKINTSGVQWKEQSLATSPAGVRIPLGTFRVLLELKDQCGNAKLDSLDLEVLPHPSTSITCSPPESINLTCSDKRVALLDEIGQNSTAFGTVQVHFSLQSCYPLDTTYQLRRSASPKGDSIWRTWTLSADLPNQRKSSTCTQLITVSTLREYQVELPADVNTLNCQESGIPQPKVQIDSCLTLRVSFIDRKRPGTRGACFDIERVYTLEGSGILFESECPGASLPVDTLPSISSRANATRLALRVKDVSRNGQERFMLYWWDEKGNQLDSAQFKTRVCADGRPLHRLIYKQIIHHFDDEAPVAIKPIPFAQSFIDPLSCRGSVVLNVRAFDRCEGNLRVLPEQCKIALQQSLQTVDWQLVTAVDPNWSWRALSGDSIQINVAELPLGRHDFLLILRDACGNTSREIRVPFEITDPFQLCVPVTAKPRIDGLILTEYGGEISRVEIKLQGTSNRTSLSNLRGSYSFPDLSADGDFNITPFRDDDHRNGVSTRDIVIVEKHILSEKVLDSPYKYVAADVDRSGAVAVLDLVLMRRVILALDRRFPNNTAWRFVDAAFPLKNESLRTGFPDTIQVNKLKNAVRADFIGVKTGDVTGDASAQLRSSGIPEPGPPLSLQVVLEQNPTTGLLSCTLPSAPLLRHQVQSIQFTLAFDPHALALEQIDYGVFQPDHMGVFAVDGLLTLSWNGSIKELQQSPALFTLRFRPKNPGDTSPWLRLVSAPASVEVVNTLGQSLPLDLDYLDALKDLILAQNRPNPFSTATTIAFYLPAPALASLSIYNAAGQLVQRIEGNYPAGWQEVYLDRRSLAAGWYSYTLATAYGVATKKMIVIDP